jgi:hypothetical protein
MFERKLLREQGVWHTNKVIVWVAIASSRVMVCQSPLPGVANSSCSCSGSRAPCMVCNQTNGFWFMVSYVWVVMASSKVVSSRVVVFESEGVSLTPAWCGKTHHVVVVRVQGAPSTGRFWSSKKYCGKERPGMCTDHVFRAMRAAASRSMR